MSSRRQGCVNNSIFPIQYHASSTLEEAACLLVRRVVLEARTVGDAFEYINLPFSSSIFGKERVEDVSILVKGNPVVRED